jgi:hypothetical protein
MAEGVSGWASSWLPNNIIHPTRAMVLATGCRCFGRVMMGVSGHGKIIAIRSFAHRSSNRLRLD